jgi:hypothetical protein
MISALKFLPVLLFAATTSLSGQVVSFGGSGSGSPAFLSGTSAAPSLNVSSCTGATIGTGSTNAAGVITGLPAGACTIVITFAAATAPHDWSCAFSNRKTPSNLFVQSNTAASATTATVSGISSINDELRYVCAAF